MSSECPTRRGCCCERHHSAKLDRAAVLQIRTAVAKGDTVRDLARRYRVHYSTVSLAARGLTWSHVR